MTAPPRHPANEIEQVVRRLVERHGTRKVRLAGGDPSSRPDLVEIIERLAGTDGVGDIAMTTHGLTLARMAHTHRKAGLQRVNISSGRVRPPNPPAVERRVWSVASPRPAPRLCAPLRRALVDGTSADIGFITPMSCKFCHAYNRLRITANGGIYRCLMDQPRGSITPAMRPALDPEPFDRMRLKALGKKAPEHPAKGFGMITRIGG